MNHSQPDRRPPASPERPPASRPTRRPPKRKSSFPLIPVLLVLVVVIAAAVWFTHRSPSEEPPEPVISFTYRDRLLTPQEGVPLSTFDPSLFTPDERGRVQYSFGTKTARTGIDVSYSQPEINWEAVAADGIQFVILRVGYRGYTEGGLYVDKLFESHLDGALAAGLDVGVYFYSQAISPEEARTEADFVLDTLNGRKLSYPVAYDWESITTGEAARTDNVDGATMTACAVAFCQRIKEGGYDPCLYLNQDQAYLFYDLSQLTDYPIWLADYRTVTDFVYDFDYWQYSHTGTVSGISQPVDLDLDMRDVKD